MRAPLGARTRAQRGWDPRDAAEVLRLIDAGETYAAVAARFDRTRSAVAGLLVRARDAGTSTSEERRGRRRPWTPQEEAVLRELAGRVTITEIAGRIDRPVAGVQDKMRRLGVRGMSPEVSAARARPTRRRHPATSPNLPQRAAAPKSCAPLPPDAEAPSCATPLLDVQPWGCRWPYGSGEAMLFCGHRQAEGSSYCPAHRALSFKRTEREYA